MANSIWFCSLLLCTLMSLPSIVSADTAPDFFEVVAGTPSRVINHEVELKGQFDDDVTETLLTGPQMFSHSVGCGEKPVRSQNAYLNWYKITEPTSEPQRILSVRDALRGNEAHQITIEDSAFLLSPAQRITTGPPSELPDGLNHLKAYKIVKGPQLSEKVELTGAFGPKDRTAVKAAFFCVPVEQWHHHDRFPIKDSQRCMLVYELLPQEHTSSVTTIDQFGLNNLEVRSSKWLCVPAQIVDRTSAESR